MRWRDASLQAASAGALAALVGFASSFTVIVHGLLAGGATQAQAASGLTALSVLMGLGGVVLSVRTRLPISVAWSTPGAALLASSGPIAGGFAAAVGAFLVTGVLIVVAGLWRPLGRAVAAIPHSLAAAMLAGILLSLCLAPVHAVAERPAMGLAIVVVWAVVARLRRLLAVPAAVLVTVALVAATTHLSRAGLGPLWPAPILVWPSFSVAGAVGVALPLFVVTMASQNIPGIAVLRVNGFHPQPAPLFTATGLLSLLAAPFGGGPAINLAAVTAAMCAGEDAHPDPARRYWAALVNGLAYIVLGVLATAATAFISVTPPVLIEAVAGLALLGAFGGALMGVMNEPRHREAAVVCFVVTASGQNFVGVSGAFWGLIAGGLMLAMGRWRRVGRG